MIEIKETGSYFKVDAEGYLVNPASKDKIQDKWRPLVDDLVELYKSHFGEKLVSVYLRGSVSKGEAVEGVSDVDSWCYINTLRDQVDMEGFYKKRELLLEKYPFCNGIESEIDPDSCIPEDQFWIAQAVLLYGQDVQNQKFKIGKEIMFHSKDPERITKRLVGMLARGDDEYIRKSSCTWLCKQILRAVMELCFERSQRYSRDLYRCWETFSEYYPDKSDELRHVLHLALNPTSDKQEILELEQKWTKWIIEEKENLGY